MVGVLLTASQGNTWTWSELLGGCVAPIFYIKIYPPVPRGEQLCFSGCGKTQCDLPAWRGRGETFKFTHRSFLSTYSQETHPLLFHLGSKVIRLWSSSDGRRRTGARTWLCHWRVPLSLASSWIQNCEPTEFPRAPPAQSDWVRRRWLQCGAAGLRSIYRENQHSSWRECHQTGSTHTLPLFWYDKVTSTCISGFGESVSSSLVSGRVGAVCHCLLPPGRSFHFLWNQPSIIALSVVSDNLTVRQCQFCTDGSAVDLLSLDKQTLNCVTHPVLGK